MSPLPGAQRSSRKDLTAPCLPSIHQCERERRREPARPYTGIRPRLANDMARSSARQTALVTGAAGFVGSHLVDRLLAEGFEVIGVDSGDVREDLGVCAQLIFNLACPASPVHYQRDPYATFTTSVVGAMRLIELARERHCTIVQASTSEIYGDPAVHPQPEGYWGHVNPIGPRACYDEGKRGAETLLSDARRCWGVDTRIVRIFNTYGPGMAINDGRVVSNFIVQALSGPDLTVCGDGQQSRSFCYVDDLVEGFLRVARLPTLEGPINRPSSGTGRLGPRGARLPRSHANSPPLRAEPPRSHANSPPLRAEPPRSHANSPPLRAEPPRSHANSPPLRAEPPRSHANSPFVSALGPRAPASHASRAESPPRQSSLIRAERARWARSPRARSPAESAALSQPGLA
jgi:UDP-glucuronate decarboxylase